MKTLLKPFAVSITSIVSIDLLGFFRSIQPDLIMLCQVVIGILTIIYLIKKIRSHANTTTNRDKRT